MGGKGVSLIHRVVDFPQGYFFRLAFQNGAAVRTPQRADQSGFLKFDQKPPNHDGICINRLGQTRRGTAIVLLQCQDRHHMHRKSKSTAGHAMNVTNLITFSKGYQRGVRRVLQSCSFSPRRPRLVSSSLALIVVENNRSTRTRTSTSRRARLRAIGVKTHPPPFSTVLRMVSALE